MITILKGASGSLEKINQFAPDIWVNIVNPSSEDIARIQQELDIPYHVRSRDTLLDDSRIEMLITLFRVIADPYNDHSLGKLLFADFLKLDALAIADTLQQYRSAKRDDPAINGLIEVPDIKREVTARIKLDGPACDQ